MFSLQSSGSFTPVYFNWFLYNSSFYSAEKVNILQQAQTKSFFPPILIAPPTKLEEKINKESACETKPENKQKIQKLDTEDEEYTPGNSHNKKMKKNQQNQNRNIMPNIVNQILSYIQKKNKSESTTQKIFQKYNTRDEWTVKRFYLYQSMLKNKISHYVNEQTMKIFMKTSNVDVLVHSQQEQGFYNKVSRILIFNFLNKESETSTLTSKRMDRSKKACHIRAQRQLGQKLESIYRFD